MAQFSLIDGFANALTLANLFYAVIGCVLGMAVGILPGLGPAAAMAIVMPLTLSLSPEGSIIIMGGLYYGAMYGGSTTAILINIPGEVASVVTAIDGYEMTKKGRAGEALAIAGIGSYIAGIGGTIAIATCGPLVAKLALRFGPPEYFSLVLFSLTALVSFAGRSLLIGLAMGIAGVWLAAVGTDPLTGTLRLTFETSTLMKGVDIVPLTVGLFGIGEVLFNARQNLTQVFDSKLPPWYKMLPTGLQLWRGLAASVRGTLVGGVMGLLPGMSPALTSYLSYDVERKISPYRRELGTGAIEGVAAPEAANNATAMTGFIPLMSLGIPTSPALALVLGVLIMNGLQPGPQLFTLHSDLTYTIIASMIISNTILLILALPAIGLWARISIIPYKVLAPLVLAVCVIGAYSARDAVSDVFIAILFGYVGYVLRVLDWPISPLILGFLMSSLFEQSLRQSLGMSNGDFRIFLERPISAAFLVATCVVVGLISYWKWRSSSVAAVIGDSMNEV